MAGKLIVFTIMIVLLALINTQAKGDWQSFPICESASEQSDPAVSGDRVVWTDKRMGRYDIYSYDLAEPNEYPIETTGGDQKQPAISGDIIVWTDDNNIIGYDLSGTGKFTVCAAGADQNYPAIDGNIVVWRDKRNYTGGNSYDIYGCEISDISDPNEFAICTDSSGQYYPDVSGNIVVWIDVRHSGSQPDIYGYNLSTKEEFEICTNASGQYNPKISGDVVVWVDDRNGNSDIYGYRISTQTEFPICIHSENQSYPAISGNLVVWQDERNGGENSNIYGYDIEGGSEFAICTETGDQINPAVAGNTVVWQQDAGSSANLYGAYRPEPSVITLVSPDGGEMILAGRATDITWQASGPEIEDVRIDYSINMGGNWNSVVSSTANTGSFEWNPVPAENSEQSLVRVIDVGDSGASDISDDTFTIFECSASLIADLNEDCFVDIKDFALFCQQWLQSGNPYDPAWPN